eukprot:c17971_g1_i1 orf=781-2496(-)
MMTAAESVGVPRMSSPPVQAAQQHLDDTKKRPRPKNVTWATQDKLHQVRLFAAEDAPSLSGLVLQDLLEAKKTKFMHALVPVSTDDLPPGFEGVATKRARLDIDAILAMVAQITWRSPERFCYDPSWRVAVGDESSEVNLQRQREVRVLEAVYPRPSAIPTSSMEPPEAPPDFGDSQVPEIPLIPTDDEEDGMEEDELSVAGGTRTSKSSSSPLKDSMSGDEASLTYPPGYSPPKDAQALTLKSQSKGGSSSAAAQFNSDLTTTFFKNADPDVAAAAAAAYAVLKAKESGALIDHELLIQILSNPLLIETLTASHQSLTIPLGDSSSSTSSSRENANGNGLKMRGEPYGEGSLLGGASSLSSFIMQGRQRYDSSEGMQGNSVVPGWGSNSSGLATSQGRGYPMVGAHEMLGQARGAYGSIGPPGRSYPPVPRQDISRELIQQHGMAGMISNEAQSRQSAAPMAFDEVMVGHELDRYRLSAVPGSKGQPWIASALPSAAIARSNLAPQDRLGGAKIRKQCFFFNTPRGCRNGVYCNFLHEAGPEKALPERMHHDAAQEFKLSRGDTPDAEAK